LFINKGKCGLYFEPEDPKSLSSAIKQILNDKNAAAQLGKNGRTYVNQYFNRNNIAQMFYDQLFKLK
jgi:glycosyltransferase involved in cell wall biosynthesis